MGTQIQLYGTSEDINQITKRYRMAVKGADKLTPNEIVSLAQVVSVTGLNPFVGEIWGIPGSGVMVGIAGARRLFKEQTEGFIEVVPVSPEEAGATEKDVVIAFKVIAHDSKKTEKYQKMLLETIIAMREANSPDPFRDAKEICGPRPQWVGYGYSTQSEKSKMNKTQLARKRAEADALKKCIVIPFGVRIGNFDNANDYSDEAVIDGETHEAEPEPQPQPQPQPIGNKEGEMRPYSPETLRSRLASQAKTMTTQPKGNEAQVISMNLDECFLGDKEKRKTVMFFLTGHDSASAIDDGMKMALKKWINPTKDSGDAWHMDPIAVKEAHTCYEHALKKQGQQTLID